MTTIRVVLPHHLRNLARVMGSEVQVQVEGAITIGSVLDAVEAAYPMLRGTIRDHGTLARRPFLRFFACEKDISLQSQESTLPETIVNGTEPFMVIGAIAGG